MKTSNHVQRVTRTLFAGKMLQTKVLMLRLKTEIQSGSLLSVWPSIERHKFVSACGSRLFGLCILSPLLSINLLEGYQTRTPALPCVSFALATLSHYRNLFAPFPLELSRKSFLLLSHHRGKQPFKHNNLCTKTQRPHLVELLLKADSTLQGEQ